MTASPNDVLVVGEALVDVLMFADGRIEQRPGGSPLNVAVGLARLEQRTRLHTMIGQDAHGRHVAAYARANNVEVTAESFTDRPTGVATALIDALGAAAYRFALEWEPRTPQLGNASWLHVGSLGATLDPGHEVVLQLLDSVDSPPLISFDPNVRPALTSDAVETRGRVESVVARAHVIKASDEDVAFLYPGEDHATVAAQWLEFGAALVVITRGEHGASAWSAAGCELEIPSVNAHVVDTVGAGDSFMAGTIAALRRKGANSAKTIAELAREDLASLLDFAARCAGVTVGRVGADLPTSDEIGRR